MNSIVIIVTLLLGNVLLGIADQQQEWYTTQIATHVLPPYSQAYRILQDGVLKELLVVNMHVLDDNSVGQLAGRLYCASQQAYSLLQQSVSASEQLVTQVDTKMLSNLAQIGTYEHEIVTKTSDILQTDEQLRGAQASLATAEQTVIEKQNGVAAAESAVREAEEAVEKARKCRGKRGWFSKITRPIVRPIENAIKDVIIKPICSVINEGGIDSAKSRRGDAHNQLNSAHAQVSHHRQLVIQYQAHKATVEQQLAALRQALTVVQSAHHILQGELAMTIEINSQLKKAGTQLSSVFAGSMVLQDTLAHLIDFESLINPLNAIYNSMQLITAMDTTIHISPIEIEQAKVSVAKIALLLSNMPFNTNINLSCV